MTYRRKPLRDMTTAEVDAGVERAQERAYARYMHELQRGDDLRDEQQEREIRELEDDAA